MHTFIWEEGTGDRGADNIITCVHMWLVAKGIVPANAEELATWDKPKLKHLVIGADNCTGQNKNKAMIKFCMWLHESGYIDKVTLLFLIKGHTKNDCDRKFNELKMKQNNKNIWDAKSLDAALSEINGDGILLKRVEEEDTWKAWGDSLGDAYRDPESGTITCNHIFEFGKDDDKCVVIRRKFRDAESDSYCMRVSSKSTSRACACMNPQQRAEHIKNIPHNLNIIPQPGLSAMKANEMENKIMPLVPKEFKYYYKRMDPKKKAEMEKTKKAKNEKRKEKKNAKKAAKAAQKKQRKGSSSTADKENDSSAANQDARVDASPVVV